MNFIQRIALVVICTITTVSAADIPTTPSIPVSNVPMPTNAPGATNAPITAELPVLHVGTESFTPPFVMQSSPKEIFGFDVDMMNSVCKILNRTCQFHIMRFGQLIDALAKNELDFAIGSITITPDRSKIVNFSLPYLLSYSRFLQRQTADTTPFSLALLNGKKIGIQSGTIFAQQIELMGIKNPTIQYYDNIPDQLTALNNSDVDFIVLDSPTATYWAFNSSNTFKLAGPAYMYGYGIGIAVNPSEGALLASLNQALLQYQNSPDYQSNYNKYLSEF